jgi:hypothetical protein
MQHITEATSGVVGINEDYSDMPGLEGNDEDYSDMPPLVDSDDEDHSFFRTMRCLTISPIIGANPNLPSTTWNFSGTGYEEDKPDVKAGTHEIPIQLAFFPGDQYPKDQLTSLNDLS